MSEEATLATESSAAVEGAEAAVDTVTEATATEAEGTLATEGDKAAEGEGTLATEGAKPAVDSTVPETYADFTLPEGIEMDEAALAVALPIFKDKSFTQDQAQAVVSLQAEMVQKAGEQQLEAWQKVVGDWRKETKDDKEFGGDKLAANLGLGAHALKTLGSKELMELLDTTGIGNSLVMNKFLAAVGNAIGEDSVTPGKSSGTDTRDPGDILYDKT